MAGPGRGHSVPERTARRWVAMPAVADMVVRQPWLEESWEFPVEVAYRRTRGEPGAEPAAEAGTAAP